VTGRRSAGTALRGSAALLTLLVLVIGLPLALYRFGGSPVPRHLPSWHQFTAGLLHRDSGAVFLDAVRDVSWLAWAAFAASVAAEAQAALRGREAPRLRLGGFQNAAAWLVAVSALAFSGQPAMLAVSQPAAAATAPAHRPPSDRPTTAPASGPAAARRAGPATASAPGPGSADPAAPAAGRAPDPQVMSMGFSHLVTVRPGDCLWTIAQRYLGNGDRYPEIVQLNLGHPMGGGQVFTDPSVIWPGWVLQLPSGNGNGQAAARSVPRHPAGSHAPHRSRDHRFARPHPSASASRPASTPSPAAPDPAPSAAPSATGTQAAAGMPTPATAAAEHSRSGSTGQLPSAVVFAAGMLAGGACVTLARMRHRQRQARRRGRRIPLPASAPVITAEQRLRAAAVPEPELAPPPATALRAALGELGAGLVAAGRQLPDIVGVQLRPSGMELLLSGPAGDPPPPPFTVPGGRQGMAWRLSLPDDLPPHRTLSAAAGDLLPGLLTAGMAADGGYFLLDLEHLGVTTADGPADLADRALRTAAAELTTSELAGWYDLILVDFPELEAADGRATSCGNLDEALDLLAAKAVALRRRLGGAETAAAGSGEGGYSEVRQRRVAQPGDEDWALAVLVSRVAPTASQMALLVDLASDPGGIAALVRGAADGADGLPAHASIRLAADPAAPGGMVADISPLGLRVWPQALADADYQALGSLFAVAADLGDVAPDEPPYDGWSWPPEPVWAEPEPEPEQPEPVRAEPEPQQPEPQQPEPGWVSPDDTQPVWKLPAEPDAGVSPADGLPKLQPVPPEREDPRPAAAAALRVGVLGTFTINGAPAALQPAQSQLVLALALNASEGLSNAQLCYLLGADPDHPKPSDSLRQLIVRTRRQLGRAADGREWIEHLGGGQYALHPEARFDWSDFESLSDEGLRAHDPAPLRQALALIRGQPFTGCYHWWLDLAFTETVRAQIVDAADLLSELELAAGDSPAAARAARAGLAADIGAEQLWRALMRAEHGAGNLAGVREAWARCLDMIADIAADGEPHPDTAALYQQLIGGPRAQPAWTGG
jgi:DNA-binding SARP family transcriptional activator